MAAQTEFNFDPGGETRGYDQWLSGRKLAAAELARKIGLPLGHKVEVWLRGQIRLRGNLKLAEELLFIEEDQLRHLELLVDHVPFAYREMESCVRLD